MGILNDMNTSSDIKSEEKDTLGGGFLLDSNIYDMIIQLAYLDKSKGGAHCINLHCKDAGDNKFRQTIYFTNRNGDNFYERDGEKNYLPGYNQLNAISLLAADKALNEIATEEKMVNVYNYDEKKEVPTKKEVLMDWINKPIKLGILNISDDKNEKNADDKYVPSGELRNINEIDKVFRASDGKTIVEIKADDDANFITEWKDKWEGEIKQKGKGIRDPSLGAAAPGGSTGNPTPAPSSLFTS